MIAAAAALLAPFGLAEIPLQIMASALDLIAAVGQTFSERPEAVRAVPRPPDEALAPCVFALLWACLWRGALRWGALPLFAASIWLYATAPLPVTGFDADLRAVYARSDEGGERWSLIAAGGRSRYARDRLGSTLGLSAPLIERLAPPEACGELSCVWTWQDQTLVFVRDGQGFANACVSGAIVLARVAAPTDFARQCTLAALLDTHDLAAYGGGYIHADGSRYASRARGVLT